MAQSQDHHPHGHSSQLLPEQQQQDFQFAPSTQNVLAEARKNLQVLIGLGISKDVLHRWVEDSRLSHSSLPIQSTPASAQQTLHILLQPQGSSMPPPSRSLSNHPFYGSFSLDANANFSSTDWSTPAPTCDIHTEIKAELRHDNATAMWKQAVRAPSASVQYMPTYEQLENDVFPPSYRLYTHRARNLGSLASSGSSGYTSLWSLNWKHSLMSGQSDTGNRSIGSNFTPTSGALVINDYQATPSGSNKHKIYWCTFCETSFKRKFDWKRHEDEFHERWRTYPCPEPGCKSRFWGSNSFKQHHKQRHGCKTCPHAEKVVKFRRKRKYWACGFCSALLPAHERYVEHVAYHFESGLSINDWTHSRVIYSLLHQPLIRSAWNTLVAEKHDYHGGRRPQFSWHPSKTGRAQGSKKKESPGQLQDWLEFFSGNEAEAQWVVLMAYDLAGVVISDSNMQSSFPSTSQQPASSQQQLLLQHFNHDDFFSQMRVQTSQQSVLIDKTLTEN